MRRYPYLGYGPASSRIESISGGSRRAIRHSYFTMHRAIGNSAHAKSSVVQLREENLSPDVIDTQTVDALRQLAEHSGKATSREPILG